MAKFEKGKSGNPRGRPRGIQTQLKLRESIAKDLPGIITALVNERPRVATPRRPSSCWTGYCRLCARWINPCPCPCRGTLVRPVEMFWQRLETERSDQTPARRSCRPLGCCRG